MRCGGYALAGLAALAAAVGCSDGNGPADGTDTDAGGTASNEGRSHDDGGGLPGVRSADGGALGTSRADGGTPLADVEVCALGWDGDGVRDGYPFASCKLNASGAPVLDFGSAPRDAVSRRAVAVYNGGGAALSVERIDLRGSTDSLALEFSIADSGVDLPQVLAPAADAGDDGVLYARVEFDGMSDAFPEAQLEIRSDDPTEPTVVVAIVGSLSACADCGELQSTYCDGRFVTRDRWSCNESSAICVDVADMQLEDCGEDACEGVCGSGANGCAFHDRECFQGACVDDVEDVDGDAVLCTNCGLAWNLDGDAACCGDDAAEHALFCDDASANGDCGTDTDACCDVADACVDHLGDCREPGSCHAFGSDGALSHCDAGTWRDPDHAAAACEATGCDFAWLSTAATCCGDDAGEDLEQAGTGNPCCYDGQKLASGSADGSILCRDGELYDCGDAAADDSGLAEAVVACEAVGSFHCRSDDSWGDAAEPGCSCTGDPDCESGACKFDHDGVGSWCAPSDQCVHDATAYAADAYSPACLDTDSRARCSGGSWTAQSCGSDACVGSCGTGIDSCSYHSRGCNAGSCYDTGSDPDADQTSCTGCGQAWALGGEVAGGACCGDDSGEYARSCDDATDDGDCGSDTDACCDTATDCVDHLGDCITAGGCGSFGNGGFTSVCDAGTWRDPDEASVDCATCGLEWSLGGETAQTDCCGDDAGEHARSCVDSSANGDCGGDDRACCDAGTDCVDHEGQCQDGDACHVFSASGALSYCDGAVWQDPDEDPAYCTATGCGFDWLGVLAACCGDDAGEDLEQPSPDAPCCYDGAVLSSGATSGSLLCFDGELYDCGGAAADDSGLAAHVGVCGSVGGLYCDGDDAWASGLDDGCGCLDPGDCSSGRCADDHDGTGRWCAGADQCVHDGVVYDGGTFSMGCLDAGSRALCSSGSWTAETCGGDSCDGTCGTGADSCQYHARGCSAGSCFDDAFDADSGMSVCAGCGRDWALGGEVASAECCGDDAGEFARTCDENAADGDCGIDAAACCDAGDDCVDHTGSCQASGTCVAFGNGGSAAVCASGSWQEPDSDAAICAGCSGLWSAGGEVAAVDCCGDDAGEHATTCVDASDNGDCGTDTDACCDASTDCVDDTGSCRGGGSCHPFGAGGTNSYCDAGTWRDPDSGSTQCTASGCGHSWLSTAAQCCGDDPGEDIEQPSGSGCCYNGAVLTGGVSNGSIMCSGGSLYDCNDAASDDSDLAESVATGDWLVSSNCTPGNIWCPIGETDCVGPDLDCDTDLNSNPACDDNTYLGFAAGDGFCYNRWMQVTGVGEQRLQLYAYENSSNTTSLFVRARLFPPADVDYDVYIESGLTCASAGASVTRGYGVVETADYRWGDTSGDDSQFITIHVGWWKGTGCGPWTLDLYVGNNCQVF